MSSGRVLIVRVGAMGDVLHALPAVAALHHTGPDLDIGWAVDTRWAPLLVGDDGRSPIVSRVHLAETRLWSKAPFSLATVRSIRWLRRELRVAGYQKAVDLQGTFRSAVIGRLAATGALAGYADPREDGAKLLYQHHLQRRGVHVVEQGAALLSAALGVELTPTPPDLPRSERARAWVESTYGAPGGGDRIVLLAPSAGWGAKEWPAERFGAVARDLVRAGFRVLMNAVHNEDSVCRRVLASSQTHLESATCNVSALVELCRRAALVIGGDSGPVHLAAALGRPIVAIFGPTDPARNGPWGPGPKRILRSPSSVTSYKHRAEVDPGMLEIQVEDVSRAAAALLAETEIL